MNKNPAHLVAEKRRLPRFHITPCQFHDSKMNKNFSVQDISLGGLSLRLVDRNDLPDFAVGTDHDGVVKLEGVKIECKFKVRFIRGTLIGVEWVNATRELIEHLDHLSSADVLGKSIKKFELSEMPDTTWYYNPVGIDLLLYQPKSESHAGIQRWILYFHQSFVHWEHDEGLRTGRALAEDDEGHAHGIVRLETRLMDYDETPDRKMLETAREFFQNAVLLGEDLQSLLLNHLKGVLP